MIRVDSSNVVKIGYDEDTQEVHIETNEGEYFYKEVPKSLYLKLMDAPSKGSFLRLFFSGSYKVEEKPSFAKLKQLSMPLIDYLKAHYNPHTKIIIEEGFVEVVMTEMGLPIKIQ